MSDSCLFAPGQLRRISYYPHIYVLDVSAGVHKKVEFGELILLLEYRSDGFWYVSTTTGAITTLNEIFIGYMTVLVSNGKDESCIVELS